MYTGARARKQKFISIYISLYMKTFLKRGEKYITIYDKRNAFSLQQKEAVLVAFRNSKLSELKNLGPWKLMENFLILVLYCGK